MKNLNNGAGAGSLILVMKVACWIALSALLAFSAVGEERTYSPQEWQRIAEASHQRVAEMYPEVLNPDSAFAQRMLEIDTRWEKSGDPRFQDPRKAEIMAKRVAEELGRDRGVHPSDLEYYGLHDRAVILVDSSSSKPKPGNVFDLSDMESWSGGGEEKQRTEMARIVGIEYSDFDKDYLREKFGFSDEKATAIYEAATEEHRLLASKSREIVRERYPDLENRSSWLSRTLRQRIEFYREAAEEGDERGEFLYYHPRKEELIVPSILEDKRKREEKRRRTPNIITAQDVKNHWIESFKIPGSLDRNYHKRVREKEEFVEEIAAGERDNEAQRIALTWNIKEYRRVGDMARAKSTQEQLNALEQRLLQERKVSALEGIEHEIRGLRWELD